MKTLKLQQMEDIRGGGCGSLAENIAGVSCGVSVAGGLLGLLIAGPTCLGLLIACSAAKS